MFCASPEEPARRHRKCISVFCQSGLYFNEVMTSFRFASTGRKVIRQLSYIILYSIKMTCRANYMKLGWVCGGRWWGGEPGGAWDKVFPSRETRGAPPDINEVITTLAPRKRKEKENLRQTKKKKCNKNSNSKLLTSAVYILKNNSRGNFPVWHQM